MLQSRTPAAGKSLSVSTAPWINLVPYGSSWQKSCWNFWPFNSFLRKRRCLESARQRDIGACVVLIALESACWHTLAQELVPAVTVLAWHRSFGSPLGWCHPHHHHIPAMAGLSRFIPCGYNACLKRSASPQFKQSNFLSFSAQIILRFFVCLSSRIFGTRDWLQDDIAPHTANIESLGKQKNILRL